MVLLGNRKLGMENSLSNHGILLIFKSKGFKKRKIIKNYSYKMIDKFFLDVSLIK